MTTPNCQLLANPVPSQDQEERIDEMDTAHHSTSSWWSLQEWKSTTLCWFQQLSFAEWHYWTFKTSKRIKNIAVAECNQMQQGYISGRTQTTHTHTHKQNLKPISNSSEEMNYSYKNFGRNAFAKSTWGPLPASNAAASATISDRPVFFVCSDWLVWSFDL